MALRRGFKAEANRIAVNIRAGMDLRPIDPLDPWRVCEHFDIEVIELSTLLAEDGAAVGAHFLREAKGVFSGMTITLGMRRAIVHNDSHAPERQRSDIAHELAHCFLKHPLVPLLGEGGDRNRDSLIEEEASFLGGVLLIPNEAAHHIVKSGLGSSAKGVYGVSPKMLAYRLRVSGANIVAARRARY
jgi:Zn-dependent peptidase ImmA (M78 family)